MNVTRKISLFSSPLWRPALMTDPNVGFSIYISDRERERLELERRKQAAQVQPPATVSAPVMPVQPVAATIPSETETKIDPVPQDEATSDTQESTAPKEAPTDEEIFASLREEPIVRVSNITTDDTPWMAKYICELAEKHRSVCDHCGKCEGYVPKPGNPGKCQDCHCDLIFHLKATDIDIFKADSDSEEEEEWDDDVLDDDEDDQNDDDDDDGAPGPSNPSHVAPTPTIEELDGTYAEGGEEEEEEE